ncbi:hypothetical protein M2324_003604 [Rhodovulum sulfidophilum]|uniref:hypothetical protein n=1 Tax=Rhodovulum sulfidophilum TaxID=35806 RepID=UPI0007B54C36|nr:hypothetical protein [Rhodovulum sulfidophilum]ANB33277.1 hypothetical protein A6W98_03810 [Rhodovulum sulfidophilum DSM 1374]ANB37125.1 hypothetical protein A6024_03795 [Rhodovulum sulfidophilum]MCW2305185.1 hypothetical protein [Rhodovulum sulfidophilum]
MRKDEDDNFLGPYPSAFEERAVDDYLSVTWCEYFVGSDDEQLRCSVEAIRSSNMDVRPKACFCLANTTDVLAAIDDAGSNGRAVYHPEGDNDAHAGIYGIAPEEAKLLARLADEVWCAFLTKDTANALPESGCAKSNDVE